MYTGVRRCTCVCLSCRAAYLIGVGYTSPLVFEMYTGVRRCTCLCLRVPARSQSNFCTLPPHEWGFREPQNDLRELQNDLWELQNDLRELQNDLWELRETQLGSCLF